MRRRRAQRGQALVLAAALAAALVLSWLLVFNVGQVVHAKQRLNFAADSAAYGAAVWEARSLNFQAYLNRGIVANEVAIAQLVSLRSWSGYLERLLANSRLAGTLVPPLGRVLDVLSRGWDAVDRTLQAGLPPLESALSRWNTDVLLHAQSLAQQQAPVTAAELVADIAQGVVAEAQVSTLTRPLQVRNAARWQDYSQIQRHGSGELREFVQLLEQSRDGFTADRGYDLLPANPLARVPKRGGTDLIGEYAWRGIDTLAMHVNLLLGSVETPIGWGGAENRHHPHIQQGEYGGARRSNPRTTRLALRAARTVDGYRGVPEVRDLRGTPDAETARLGYAVVLEQPQASIATADRVLGIRAIGDASREAHDVAPWLPDGRLRALGAAEIYFRRPDARLDGREERPSLFSPYWQARLTARPTVGLRALVLGAGAGGGAP